MRAISTGGRPRRGVIGAAIAISLGLVVLGTGLSFAATQDGAPPSSDVQICDATFVSGGGTTASGEQSDANSFTAASGTFPIGSSVRVTNPVTNKSVTVRINDKSTSCVAMELAAFDQIRTPGKNLIRGAKVQQVQADGQVCDPAATDSADPSAS